jgi:ribosomal protein S18 acetylase RimI-like enzyme
MAPMIADDARAAGCWPWCSGYRGGVSIATAEIRPMRAADVAPAAELMRRGDWGDRTTFLAWAVGHPSCHPLVAEVGGEVLGTGIATAYGGVGWVGTIFVDQESRGQGLGRSLTQAVVEDLEASGCRTLLLIATEHGRPLYEHEGFTVLTEQRRFAAAGTAEAGPDERVRPFSAQMLPAISALDREANGEDRALVLRALATPETLRVALGADGSIRGFLLRGPWGGAALVAPDPDDAVHLLDWRRQRAGPDGRVATGLPGLNAAGRDRLIAEGWVEERGGTRMIRGAPLEWQPESVWGQLNGALG